MFVYVCVTVDVYVELACSKYGYNEEQVLHYVWAVILLQL